MRDYYFVMKRLSIIIPIYNVEKYVEKCISSLMSQDISPDEYEIICINDGSPDFSSEVVRKMQGRFSNIILIDQENQGVSGARNNGIDIATGKYLIFIDPDDYVEPNSFKRVLDRADRSECQVSFLGFTILSETGNPVKQVLNKNQAEAIFKGTDAYFISRGNGQNDPDRMWAVLFRRDLFDRYNLRYLIGVPYLEDGEFIARILCLSDRCIFDGNPFYFRTTRRGSATNSRLFNSDKAINGFIKAAINLKSFKDNQELDHNKKNFLNQAICKFAVLVITSSARPFSLKRIRSAKKRLCEKELCKLDLRSTDLEYRVLGSLYNMSVYLLIVYQFLFFRFTRIWGKLKR